MEPSPAPTGSQFHVRSFQPSDTAAVHALFANAQFEYGNSDEYARHAIAHDLSDIRAHYVAAPRSAFFCAVDSHSHALLGIAGIRPLAVGDAEYYDECLQAAHYPSAAVPFDPRQTAELNRMAVHPTARRRGIARSLIRHCLAHCHAQHYSHLHLSTLATMRPAVAFYSACGFRRYRTDRQNWMHDARIGTDAMRRAYVERGERAEDRTRCWIEEAEVPADEQTGLELRERGIYFQTHLIISVEKWAASQAQTSALHAAAPDT